MSPLLLSVLLSLVSAVAYAAAAIVQERVAASAAGPRYAPLRSPAWWVSVLLNGLGATLHVIALAFGPLSLVQPLGALTIVFALPMAALFVGRKAGRRAWRGALMATVGLAGLLSLTNGTDAQSLTDGERWLLAAGTSAVVAVLFTAAHLVGRSVLRSVILAAAAGVSFGMASVFTKSVAEEWTSGAPLAEWTGLLVLSGLAVTGLLLSQASYRGAGLAAPLATVTVVNPVVAAAVGLTLFGESFRYGAAGTVAALICGAVAAGGLVQLTLDRMTVPPEALSVSDPAGEARPGRTSGSSGPSGPPVSSGSDGDAPRPEVGQRVDVGAVPGTRPYLEVEMRSRAVAGRP
ncbi:DMT family transporter [Streptomyces stackebrandtii]|uniref:DMT family transporter n=1 Tax=Streptomyces stackebrandtii TaxID=3051177 RepID=UPI0028DCB4A0|nr:DMT family transporter [Streptomyces sp. DSM 40976]